MFRLNLLGSSIGSGGVYFPTFGSPFRIELGCSVAKLKVQTIIQRFNGDGMNFAIVLSVFNGLPKTHLVSSMQHLNRSFKGLTTPGSLSKMQSEKDSQAAPGGFRISAMVSDLPSPIRVLSVADEPVLLSTRQRILELRTLRFIRWRI